MKVRYYYLSEQFGNCPDLWDKLKKFVATGDFTLGKPLKEFEDKFAKFHKKKYGITVSNGTAALEIAIKSLNLKKNSEVIIPTFSIISSLIIFPAIRTLNTSPNP